MSDSVFVVSEWLAKKGKENLMEELLVELIAKNRKEESGCISAHATHQIDHPGSPGKSKFHLVLLQEYKDVESFDEHCQASYVKDFYVKYIENTETSIVEDWRCRLFRE